MKDVITLMILSGRIGPEHRNSSTNRFRPQTLIVLIGLDSETTSNPFRGWSIFKTEGKEESSV
jgi:hypothetical protein